MGVTDKVKDLFHKDKDSRVEHYGPSSGSGVSERAGAGHGTHGTTGVGHGTTGVGHGTHGTTGAGQTGSNITGVGAGHSHGAAKTAANEAARQDKDVKVNTGSGVATGKPVDPNATVTGIGAGGHPGAAKSAANEAANRERDVSLNTGSGTAHGEPVGGHARTTAPTTGTGHAEGDVIDRKYYTGTEERPQDQALVEKFREHNPYAKEYETTVRHTGRERQVGQDIEALGTRERVVGQDHVVGNPHHEIHRNLPSGAINERPGGEGWVEGKPGPVCDSNSFTIHGDRPVEKERVTDLKQHNVYEKEFEVATRLKGERAVEHNSQPELLNRERVLVDEKKKNACAGHPNV